MAGGLELDTVEPTRDLVAEFIRQDEDAVYMLSSCALVLQTFLRDGNVLKRTPEMDEFQKKKKSSCAFSHESRSFSYCFHLISSWCLHYRAVLSAYIEHHATLCCRGGHLPKTWQWVKF